MRAAVIREFGTPDIFRIEEVATPQPGPGHVLVKILAAGVNRFDQYIREGIVKLLVNALAWGPICCRESSSRPQQLGGWTRRFRSS